MKVFTLSVGSMEHNSVEDALATLRNFYATQLTDGEIQAGVKSMFVVSLNWGRMADQEGSLPLIRAHRKEKMERLREAIAECTENLKYDALCVVVAQVEDPLCDTFYTRARQDEAYVIHLEDSRSSFEGPENGSPVAGSSSATASSSSSSSGKNSPEIPSVGSRSSSSFAGNDSVKKEECPICLEDVSDMKTPCCKNAICTTCWNDSLESTAIAGNGGHAPQCPLCKAEEKTWKQAGKK